MKQNWEGKVLAITGGTGSFGKKFLQYSLKYPVKEIRILSRDEFKHDQLSKTFTDSRVKFHICDVRDRSSVFEKLDGADYLFHAAALKQVPSCERQPYEAVKTNILGSQNVLEASVYNNLESVVVLSTDKAVEPINTMGISKAMMEKLTTAMGRKQTKTKINVTRYGNVLFSRGSVLPYFFRLAYQNKPLTITDPNMTRFLLPLSSAIKLVEYALFQPRSGSVFVRKSPAANVQTIADTIIQKVNPMLSSNIIGVRPGEKIHETLLTEEEFAKSVETELYYEVRDNRGLQSHVSSNRSYSSDNTEQLTQDALWSLMTEQEELYNYYKATL